MMTAMQLPSALTYLVDEAINAPDGDAFLTELADRLIADGMKLAGGALTQAAPHPIIERRTWLWRADTGKVIEALNLALPAGAGPGNVARNWLAGIGTGVAQEDFAGAGDGAVLAWKASRPFSSSESERLREVARFAAAPLALLAARSTTSALLTAYLGRRSAAQVLAGRLRRGPGETIQAALLFADLRGFTELSEAAEAKQVIAALDAWFDRIAGAVHAFGGEVLKFIGDGVLAIFPIGGQRDTAAACEAALRAVAAARAGMDHLQHVRTEEGAPPLPFGMALHLGEMLWGNIGTADRLDFTAIGPAVNLVSRLQGLCRPLGQTLLLSGTFAAETTQPLIPLGEHKLRGIALPCAVFTLT